MASPVAGADALYVSGLAAFNTGNFHALSLDPAAKDRELWSKSPPYLKLPTVSAPALADGKVIFGDGMHQTDGAILHCVDAKGGRPVWQFVLPGELVHLEGTPAVAGGKAFMGGGSAGVLAVDVNRVTLDGQELAPADAQAALDKLWKAALAKFEEEKKKDPTFAVPPSDDSLPKPAPKLLWRQGEGKWHVDGSVALAGDRLLVPSTYLDKEQTGDRAHPLPENVGRQHALACAAQIQSLGRSAGRRRPGHRRDQRDPLGSQDAQGSQGGDSGSQAR